MNIQNLKLNALLLNSSPESFKITDEDREWIDANACNKYSLKDDIFLKKEKIICPISRLDTSTNN